MSVINDPMIRNFLGWLGIKWKIIEVTMASSESYPDAAEKVHLNQMLSDHEQVDCKQR